LKCNPADVSDLVKKMRLLLENTSLRKDLIEQGYRRVKEFSWERCARQTLAIYSETL
jgi:glycosyltransferase involved in cell wall biosynthesis